MISPERFFNAEFDPAYAQRSRLIFKAARTHKPKTILDAGCGRGFYLKLFSELPGVESIVGVDANPEYLKLTREVVKKLPRISVVESRLESLPFADSSFDFICFTEVLEHVADEHRVLHELRRVLKPGGTLVLTVPNEKFPFLWDPLNWILMRCFNTHIPKGIWWLAGIWADHERLYTAQRLEALTREYFRIQAAIPVTYGCWPLSHFLLYGLGKNLIELGGMKSFSRFEGSAQGGWKKALAATFTLPARFFDRFASVNRSVNLFLHASKS